MSRSPDFGPNIFQRFEQSSQAKSLMIERARNILETPDVAVDVSIASIEPRARHNHLSSLFLTASALGLAFSLNFILDNPDTVYAGNGDPTPTPKPVIPPVPTPEQPKVIVVPPADKPDVIIVQPPAQGAPSGPQVIQKDVVVVQPPPAQVVQKDMVVCNPQVVQTEKQIPLRIEVERELRPGERIVTDRDLNDFVNREADKKIADLREKLQNEAAAKIQAVQKDLQQCQTDKTELNKQLEEARRWSFDPWSALIGAGAVLLVTLATAYRYRERIIHRFYPDADLHP